VILIFAFVSGCGGGGTEDSGVAGPAKTASWAPPATFSDGTPLNPATDLSSYEIFVKESGSFSDADMPMAIVSAVDPATHQTTTSFNLANLGPFLQTGVTYYVSLRAVSLDGLKSAFSAPASFSL
jgi:hypothetical protein